MRTGDLRQMEERVRRARRELRRAAGEFRTAASKAAARHRTRTTRTDLRVNVQAVVNTGRDRSAGAALVTQDAPIVQGDRSGQE